MSASWALLATCGRRSLVRPGAQTAQHLLTSNESKFLSIFKDLGGKYEKNIYVHDERKDDERRAGGIIPLIDQKAAGFSDGTFDIFINDKYDDNMKLFFAEYPVLQNVKVEKKLLTQWIRLHADMDVFSDW